jgi:hypothetical protein
MKRLIVFTAALVIAVASLAGAQGKTMTARGAVKSVAADSLVITANDKDMTFAVDNTTKVVGKGMGTKSNEAKKEGKGLTITDVIKAKDNVVVEYHDLGGGKLHAASVRVR